MFQPLKRKEKMALKTSNSVVNFMSVTQIILKKHTFILETIIVKELL